MNLSKKEKIGLIIFISILLCIISYNYFSNKKNKSVEVINKETIIEKAPVKIKAYICGEVVKPGVYVVNDGDRVITLVDMAGGFKSTADQYGVNLSLKIKDEDFIKIPSKQELAVQTQASGAISINTINTMSNGKININTADKSQFESLPRIGEVLAQRIIDYRNKNGPFKKIEEITNVSGIGQKTFDGFKDKIAVN